MKRSISKAAADKLGDRLRKSEEISEEDLRLLQDFRRDYDLALASVEMVLRNQLNLDPTSRIKTRNTILEKLRRDKTRLSTMQDVAGVRIVKEMTLDQQDSIVRDICREFPDHRIDDRRAEPMHGYRAVHVIVTVGGFPVEIQVRTQTQHVWAELVEKLADRWGRQIRYGELPDESDRREQGGTRQEIIDAIIQSSEAFTIAETRRAQLELELKAGFTQVHGGRGGAPGYRQRVLEQGRRRRATKEFKEKMEQSETELRLIFENALRGLEEEE